MSQKAKPVVIIKDAQANCLVVISSRSLFFESVIFYFFKNAENKSIGSGRNVVVLCSLAISRMVWR